jgi:hypothetical protein
LAKVSLQIRFLKFVKRKRPDSFWGFGAPDKSGLPRMGPRFFLTARILLSIAFRGNRLGLVADRARRQIGYPASGFFPDRLLGLALGSITIFAVDVTILDLACFHVPVSPCRSDES